MPDGQGNTQYTRAIPLDWDPTQYGGDQDHPVIWDSPKELLVSEVQPSGMTLVTSVNTLDCAL